MEIAHVVGALVCTQRIAGLEHWQLRILADAKGRKVVATDPVGARPGNWVFTVSGSAARYAMGDPRVLTDLTIGGIIDAWEPEGVKSLSTANAGASAGTESPTGAGGDRLPVERAA